jgi:hypothetical protein
MHPGGNRNCELFRRDCVAFFQTRITCLGTVGPRRAKPYKALAAKIKTTSGGGAEDRRENDRRLLLEVASGPSVGLVDSSPVQ